MSSKGGGTGGGTPPGGGTTGGGSTTGSLTCSSTSNYVGNSALAGTAASLLGSVACIDQAALAYRQTLPASISGSDATTVDIYGPFENGFTSSVPGMTCLGSNTVDGGVDTWTATLMVRHLCNDDTMTILDTCGDHANPRHFHEYLTRCLTQPDSVTGHSSRLGTAGDGLGVYGPLGNGVVAPKLDACGATFGVTPDSNGVAVPYYVSQDAPPFFVGCYTSNASTTLSECEALYTGCSSTPVTITTSFGSGPYREWCPCWNEYGSNAGVSARPPFWPPLYNSSTHSPPPSPPPPSPLPPASTTPPTSPPILSPSPSPSPPPPSPSPPPLATPPPPEAAGYVVTFTAVVAGDETSFDRESYKSRVATLTGAATSRITLHITAASINVLTDIASDSYTSATSVSSALSQLSGNATAAAALLGVQVESVSSVSMDASSPPPPPSAPPDHTTTTVLLIVVVSVASAAAVAVAYMAAKYLRPSAKTEAAKPASATESAVVSLPLLPSEVAKLVVEKL